MGDAMKKNLNYILLGLAGLLLIATIVISLTLGKKKPEATSQASTERKSIMPTITTEVVVEITDEEVEQALEPVSELITMNYRYKDVGSYTSYKTWFDDEKIPFTTDYQLFTYTGTVKLGYDFSKVTYSVDNENKKITVTLPEVEVIANEIDHDSFEVQDEKSSVFNQQSFDDFASVENELIEKKNAEVLADDEAVEEASQNAELIMKDFLQQNEKFDEYDIVFLKAKDSKGE